MRVLVDTCVWSLALRRRRGDLSPEQGIALQALNELIGDGRVIMIGPIRQELLSGLRDDAQFARLKQHLRAFTDEPLAAEDFEEAAQCYNRCRAAGIAGSGVDFLLCATAIRREVPLFTTDDDFRRYASQLPLRLYVLERSAG